MTSILPAGIRLGRESASLARAVKGGPQGNPTPGRWRALSLSAMVLYSVQMGKQGLDADLIHPVTRECAIDAADGLPMLWICHTAAKAPHRLCASSHGSAWAFLGLPHWEENVVSDGHHRAPCSPQIFRSSLKTFSARSSLTPRPP